MIFFLHEFESLRRHRHSRRGIADLLHRWLTALFTQRPMMKDVSMPQFKYSRARWALWMKKELRFGGIIEFWGQDIWDIWGQSKGTE
jgi:hypothetical protein